MSGCAITFAVGYLASLLLPFPPPANLEELVFSADARRQFSYRVNWPRRQALLVVYFFLLLGVLALIQHWAG